MKFAVLMTCHNRSEITCECLHRLSNVIHIANLKFDVWLNDDGCVDGTSDLVAQKFPAVKIIEGSGRDYWCGGMRRVWESASKHFNYDGYLWLNDDTWLYENAFDTLFDDKERIENNILVGAICGRDCKTATYGGEDENGFVAPDGTWRRLRQMNGNVVWVPRTVFKQLGNFDKHWTHAYGDGDYSRTANEKGIGVYLSPKFVGTCDKNGRLVDWRNPSVPLLRRLRSLYSPLGYAEPANMFRYCLRHDGFFHAVKLVAKNHLIALFPR